MDDLINNIFVVGSAYTREKIKEMLGEPAGRGGMWYTGYHKHRDAVFIFTTIGMPARTGHDYGDRWLPDGTLEWFGKTQATASQPLIRYMTREGSVVLLFTREYDRDPFTFSGRASAQMVFDEHPVRVIWRLA